MAAPADDGDPRLLVERDVRPVVAPARSDRSTGWIGAVVLLISGVVLFAILDAHRRSASAPAIAAGTMDEAAAPASPAPLFIPPAPPPEPVSLALPAPPMPTFVAPSPAPRIEPPRPVFVPSAPAPAPPPPAHASTDPALVVDTPRDLGGDAPASGSTGSGATSGTAVAARRVAATVMHHRATTVPQGTLIPAVLETALDSTRPGFARALVSSDVRGFDGSQVLIPRGSRLIGEYHAEVQPGQNRALVTWTQLVRPDGVTIAIGSPAADPLGQIGIKGDVNSHFLAKFGAAILQSALDVGVNLASRAGSGAMTVLAVPNTVQGGLSPLASGTQVQPTLRIRQGAGITVFVARDLDFTSVETVP